MTRTPQELFRLGLLSLGVNVVLMLVKISVGVLGHSYALVADGIESASDVFTTLVTWLGFRYSLKPADSEHPYGHGKVESLTGLFSGFALLGAAAVIAYNSILEIVTPHYAPAWYTIVVLLAVVVVKELLSRKVFAANQSLDSQSLQGDAWHHRSDAITSAAAAIGIAIALIGGPGYESADDWGALAACVIIVINGGMIIKNSLHDVLDGQVSDAIVRDIRSVAAATPGVVNTEKCRVRKSGIDLFVEIHIRVDPHITVYAGHEISHDVKARLQAHNPRIKDVLAHIEPAGDGE